MKLYDLIKDRIKDPLGVISDNEMVVLNRRDFLYSETSTALAFLKLFNSERVTYEMYAIIDYLHSMVCKVRAPTEVRVYQLSQSMTLPSLSVSVMLGDMASTVRFHAPRGVQAINAKEPFAKELALKFESRLNSGLSMGDIGASDGVVDILLCNASNEAEVSSALQSFEKVKRGFILIKGYGRAKAPNCGEIILSARLNVHCALAGFGVCVAI